MHDTNTQLIYAGSCREIQLLGVSGEESVIPSGEKPVAWWKYKLGGLCTAAREKREE